MKSQSSTVPLVRFSAFFLALATTLALLAPTPASAQLGGEGVPSAEQLVQVSAAPVSVPAGGRATAVVKIRVLDTWHVNANPPAFDYNIPTVVSLQGASGLTPGAAVYPAGKSQKFSFEDQPLLVYDGTFEVRVPITAAASAGSTPSRARPPGRRGTAGGGGRCRRGSG